MLCGCSKKLSVDGEVFVVRADHETVTMSGVTVFAGPASSVLAAAEKLKAEVDSFNSAVADRVSAAKRNLAEAREALHSARNAARKNREAISHSEDLFRQNASEMQFLPTTRQPLAARNRELQKRIAACKQAQPNLDLAESAAESDALKAETQLRSAGVSASTMTSAWSDRPFEGMLSATTDGRGRFHITIPKNQNWAVAVRGNRRVFESTDFYLWAVEIKEPRVILSNKNWLAVWEIKEMDPADRTREL
jgi:hypothetical protein